MVYPVSYVVFSKSLSLVRDVGTLADDLVVEIAEGEVLLDVDRTYKGVVTGE